MSSSWYDEVDAHPNNDKHIKESPHNPQTIVDSSKALKHEYEEAQALLRKLAHQYDKILIVCTGGTITSVHKDGSLETTSDGTQIVGEVLGKVEELNGRYDLLGLPKQIDSAKVEPGEWYTLAKFVHEKVTNYRGVVITHGTDTLAYTGAALTFLFRHLVRPVVLVAAQVPLSTKGGNINYLSDGIPNLIGACKLALADDTYFIPAVTIFFNRTVYQASRALKMDAAGFDAFGTPRSSILGEMTAAQSINCNSALIGYICHRRIMQIKQKQNTNTIDWSKEAAFDLLVRQSKKNMHPRNSTQEQDNEHHEYKRVVSLHLYPGITVEDILGLTRSAEGLVLRSYGTGNGPPEVVKEAVEKLRSQAYKNRKRMVILNVTECHRGEVVNQYKAGDFNVRSLRDMSAECAFAKLWVFLNFCFKDDISPQSKQSIVYTSRYISQHTRLSFRGEVGDENALISSTPIKAPQVG